MSRSRLMPSTPLGRFALWVGGIAGALFLAVGAFTTIRLLSIYRDLDRARSLINAANVQINDGQIKGAREGLTVAQGLLTEANTRLFNNAELDLIGWVPVVSQNLDSLRDSTERSLTLVDGGRRLLAISEPLEDENGKLEVPLRSGAIPVRTVRAAATEARSLATVLPGETERPSTTLVLGPIAGLQNKLYDELNERRAQLDNVSRALELLSDMSGDNGPRRYFIAVANTAEMRGSGGMVLSYGILEASGGDFELGNFGNIDELFLDEPVDAALAEAPEDFMTRWREQQPDRLWRSANLSPDFELNARLMEAMFEKATNLPVDGVIQVDPAGLAAILDGIGPVQVEGLGEVNADNVVDITLNRAYTDFPERDLRQEVLEDVAQAVFEKLVDGDYPSLRPLGRAIVKTGAQRHIMFHAIRTETQNQARFFGADGALPAPNAIDSAVLTVQNFSRNKLDYYVDTSLELKGRRPAGKVGRLTATVTVTNTAPPDGQPVYVFGPNYEEEQNGLYRGVVSLYLPNGASLVDSEGQTSVPPALTTEEGRTVVGFSVEVAAGESRAVTLEFQMAPRPPGPYFLQLVPMPRVRPTSVAIDIAADGQIISSRQALTKPVVLRPRATAG